MAEGLKIVNKLTEEVSSRISTEFTDTFVIIGTALLVLEEDDELAKMMLDYLHKEILSG